MFHLTCFAFTRHATLHTLHITTAQLYMFPCTHIFHVSCAIEYVRDHFKKHPKVEKMMYDAVIREKKDLADGGFGGTTNYTLRALLLFFERISLRNL